MYVSYATTLWNYRWEGVSGDWDSEDATTPSANIQVIVILSALLWVSDHHFPNPIYTDDWTFIFSLKNHTHFSPINGHCVTFCHPPLLFFLRSPCGFAAWGGAIADSRIGRPEFFFVARILGFEDPHQFQFCFGFIELEDFEGLSSRRANCVWSSGDGSWWLGFSFFFFLIHVCFESASLRNVFGSLFLEDSLWKILFFLENILLVANVRCLKFNISLGDFTFSRF